MKRDVPLVVIASDDAEMRKQLYAPLRRQEYFVTTCAAGAEALEVVRRGKPGFSHGRLGAGSDAVAGSETLACRLLLVAHATAYRKTDR